MVFPPDLHTTPSLWFSQLFNLSIYIYNSPLSCMYNDFKNNIMPFKIISPLLRNSVQLSVGFNTTHYTYTPEILILRL